MRRLDAVLLLWTALWVVLGIVVGVDVERLGKLSDTVSLAGSTLDATASALGALTHVPFIGGQLDVVVRQVHQTALSTQASAVASHRALDQLAVVLGVVVALVPTAPLVLLYLPLRLGWRRDVESVRAAHAAHGEDPAFREFLARRAVENLPYRTILAITANPWRDIRELRTDALARAELQRLGITEPPG